MDIVGLEQKTSIKSCRVKWYIAVACLILVVAAAFVLLFGERYVTESEAAEDAFCYLLDYPWSNGGYSHAWGMPIMLSIEHDSLTDRDVVWELTVQDGEFYLDSDAVADQITEEISWVELAYLGSHFTVKNGTSIQWINDYLVFDDDASTKSYHGASTYVDAVIRADGHIVGYIVLEIAGLPNPLEGYEYDLYALYEPVVVDAEFYPMVNGEFQNVTEEYIDWQIRKAKLFG